MLMVVSDAPVSSPIVLGCWSSLILTPQHPVTLYIIFLLAHYIHTAVRNVERHIINYSIKGAADTAVTHL